MALERKYKILDQQKLKAFANDKIYGTKNLKFVLGWIENLTGKGAVFILGFEKSGGSSKSVGIIR